jgi:hypothetical protein
MDKENVKEENGWEMQKEAMKDEGKGFNVFLLLAEE